MRPDDGAVVAAGHFDVLVVLHRDRFHRLGPRASDRHGDDRVHVAVHQHDPHIGNLPQYTPFEGPLRYVRASSTLNSLRIRSATSSVSLSLSSRRFGGSFGSLSTPGGNAPRRPCGGAAAAPAVGPSLAAPRAESTGGAGGAPRRPRPCGAGAPSQPRGL